MKSSSRGKALLVVLLATMAWLLPLLWTLQRQRATRERVGGEPRGAPAPLPREVKPLILYVEAWPTRATLNLREIQGLTGESERTLAPAHLADHLYSALGRLGISPEIHRIDRLPPSADLAKFRPIVVVYPVRHGRPAAEVGAFFDQRIERFVAQQGGNANLAVTDVTVSETPEQGAAAQASLAAMNRYYGLPYAPGPRLGPQVSLYAETQLIAEQAAAIRREVVR
jgi:hypothetical protein